MMNTTAHQCTRTQLSLAVPGPGGAGVVVGVGLGRERVPGIEEMGHVTGGKHCLRAHQAERDCTEAMTAMEKYEFPMGSLTPN